MVQITKPKLILIWTLVLVCTCAQIALSVSTASLGEALGVLTQDKESLQKNINNSQAALSAKTSLTYASQIASDLGYSHDHKVIFLEPEKSVASIR